MPHRDAYVFSADGTMRRDTLAGRASPFASVLKALSEPKAETTKKPAAPTITRPAPGA